MLYYKYQQIFSVGEMVFTISFDKIKPYAMTIDFAPRHFNC